jgi:hypothetical protein
MARKRGGLAGIYDRNKKYIKTLAPIAAGFIPGVGPMVGAALGAAMGGDREGKGYFKGFDAGGAALGGATGYVGGKLGQAAGARIGQAAQGGGLKSLLTGSKAAASGAPAGPLAPQQAVGQGGGFFPGTGGAGVNPLSAPTPADKGFSMGGLLKGVRENKDIIGGAVKGAQMMMPDPSDEAAMMNADTSRMRFEEEQRQMKLEEERRRRMAELLMPYFQQMFPNFGR